MIWIVWGKYKAAGPVINWVGISPFHTQQQHDVCIQPRVDVCSIPTHKTELMWEIRAQEQGQITCSWSFNDSGMVYFRGRLRAFKEYIYT